MANSSLPIFLFANLWIASAFSISRLSSVSRAISVYDFCRIYVYADANNVIESVKIANKPMENLVNLCFNSWMSLTDFLSACVFIQFDSTFYFIEICGRD